MKTAEKLAAGWLLTLGFMFMTLSVSAVLENISMQKTIKPVLDDGGQVFDNNNAVYANNNTAAGGFIFGVPTLILGGWLTLGLYRQSRQEKKALNQQKSEELQSTFYKMIEENKGRVTVLGFAMQSELPAAQARKYLDDRAKEFHANFKVSEDGAVSYHFEV
ncbi:MAG: hypothetical protein ACHBN1_22750 [Heteroscytonema crispum UTEX LB 1556]